jgi:uncharacterized protein YprB with RNaseH-like and TPR domain
MKADIGQITSIGIIKDSKIEVKFVETPEKEKEALEWLKNELGGCDLLVTWFGSGFDLPYILSRAIINDVDLHEILKIPSLDLCKFCQQNLSLTRYSLVEVAKSFGIQKNVEIDGKDVLKLYLKAVRGDKKAKETIVNHCRDDLIVLKEIFQKLEKYINSRGEFHERKRNTQS